LILTGVSPEEKVLATVIVPELVSLERALLTVSTRLLDWCAGVKSPESVIETPRLAQEPAFTVSNVRAPVVSGIKRESGSVPDARAPALAVNTGGDGA
jgi:hypothetical protein